MTGDHMGQSLRDPNSIEREEDHGVRRIRCDIDTTLTSPRAQYSATHGKSQKRKPLRYEESEAPANPCNTLCLTRNEQVSGSSPLVGFAILL
jgi:hypothetical protein